MDNIYVAIKSQRSERDLLRSDRRSSVVDYLASLFSRIHLPKEVFVDQNRSQALAYMNETAKVHYSEHNGKLPVWGEITGYVLHLPDGTEVRWSENISI